MVLIYKKMLRLLLYEFSVLKQHDPHQVYSRLCTPIFGWLSYDVEWKHGYLNDVNET